MADPHSPPDRPTAEATHALLDALAVVKARAELTRRRIRRVPRLSRAHIAEDLALIETQAERMAHILAERPPPPTGDDSTPPSAAEN